MYEEQFRSLSNTRLPQIDTTDGMIENGRDEFSMSKSISQLNKQDTNMGTQFIQSSNNNLTSSFKQLHKPRKVLIHSKNLALKQ